ncbi:hypothetical protein BHE74_00002904 [Ensete ventricosum]|nr:hypothetical protein GW17_00011675 [Ensete ventricosum]RWW88225.1 hypothetical protein BHE74_00002904 [Ensete ventricosum]RZR76144.1 hypothetical protein BHM03_00000768 [Ensete ventricosum]
MVDESSGLPGDDLRPPTPSLAEPLPAPTETKRSIIMPDRQNPRDRDRKLIRLLAVGAIVGATGSEEGAEGEGGDVEGEEHEKDDGEREERRQGQRAGPRFPTGEEEEALVGEPRLRLRHEWPQQCHAPLLLALSITLKQEDEEEEEVATIDSGGGLRGV